MDEPGASGHLRHHQLPSVVSVVRLEVVVPTDPLDRAVDVLEDTSVIQSPISPLTQLIVALVLGKRLDLPPLLRQVLSNLNNGKPFTHLMLIHKR